MVIVIVITIIICIFAKGFEMNVLMTDELKGLYLTGKSKVYKDVERNPVLYKGFTRAVDSMMSSPNIEDLKTLSFLHYEQLKYQYSGFSSVRLSNRYVHRLLFTESENGIEVQLINIDDTHYGNK